MTSTKPKTGRRSNRADKGETKPRRRGRPSSYKPEFVGQAEKLCRLGATDVDLADFFGVAISTISNWKIEHPEFLEALKTDKATADARVERSLYNRALGYSYDAVKIFKNKGEAPVRVPYREHVPPDVTAAIFWLKNRRPDLWRDRTMTEHTGKDGGPIEIIRRTLQEIEKEPFELPTTESGAIRPDMVKVKEPQAVPTAPPGAGSAAPIADGREGDDWLS